MSCDTPPSAWLTTPCEMPADTASAEMLETKVLKSPPQRAAKEGVERRRAVRRTGKYRKGMWADPFPTFPPSELVLTPTLQRTVHLNILILSANRPLLSEESRIEHVASLVELPVA